MVAKSLTITGDGAVHSFAAALGLSRIEVKWMQGTTPLTGNASNVLIGGNEVTSTVGFPLPPAYAGMFFPPIAETSTRYDLTQQYYWAAAGDKLNVLYAVD
jgi:hypothetical protein